jgi:hypothetical protein
MQVINTLSYLIIIHSRFEKREGVAGGWACHFFFARWFHFMLTLLGRIILNKNKEQKKKK